MKTRRGENQKQAFDELLSETLADMRSLTGVMDDPRAGLKSVV